jgi:hypothetical protein
MNTPTTLKLSIVDKVLLLLKCNNNTLLSVVTTL